MDGFESKPETPYMARPMAMPRPAMRCASSRSAVCTGFSTFVRMQPYTPLMARPASHG